MRRRKKQTGEILPEVEAPVTKTREELVAEKIRKVPSLAHLTDDEIKQVIDFLRVVAGAAWAVVEKEGEMFHDRGTLFANLVPTNKKKAI